MSKYRIPVSIDGKNFFWILVNKGKFIKNPIKDDLIGTKTILYNKTNICARCREENNITDNSILYPGNVRHDTDKSGKTKEEWVCRTHGEKHWARYDPNSQSNAIKSLRNRRTGNLTDPGNVLGDNCERMTDIIFGTRRLSEKYNSYNLPLDHSPITEGVHIDIGGKLVDLSWKIPQTKGCKRSYGSWDIRVDREHGKKFDIIILYCVSADRNIIERIYIIPKDEIIKTSSIHITKNPTDCSGGPIHQKYEKYKVADKDLMARVNETWKKILKINFKEGG